MGDQIELRIRLKRNRENVELATRILELVEPEHEHVDKPTRKLVKEEPAPSTPPKPDREETLTGMKQKKVYTKVLKAIGDRDKFTVNDIYLVMKKDFKRPALSYHINQMRDKGILDEFETSGLGCRNDPRVYTRKSSQKKVPEIQEVAPGEKEPVVQHKGAEYSNNQEYAWSLLKPKYECPKCGERFYSFEKFRDHMEDKHATTLNEEEANEFRYKERKK